MKLIVCAVKDLAAECFGQPFVVPAIGVAKRHFADQVNKASEGNMWNLHPEHFELYQIGTYDDQLGVIENKGLFVGELYAPKLLERGEDVRRTA